MASTAPTTIIIKAIIFDMDGVLFDSQPMHFAAEKETISRFGKRATVSEFKKTLGWTELDFWERMRKVYRLPATAAKLREIKRPIFEELLKNSIMKDAGLRKLILGLKRKGMRIAVASSAPRRWIRMTLEGLGITDCFDAIVSSEDVARGKPAPDVFLRAAEKLKVDPALCVVVEDAPAGIEAANSAGMHSIALRTKTNRGLDLSKAAGILRGLELLPERLETII